MPARNETFLAATIRDLLAKAQGEIEIICVLDGYWEHSLPSDARLKILHRGKALGMRPAVNAAAQFASGAYLMKCDAHTLWADGYDLQLKADLLEPDWILVPRRYALDPKEWVIDPTNKKYPVDYHYLSEPFAKHGDSTPGLHGTAWTARREARKDIELDDEMTSQGSAWFMRRDYFDRIGPQEIDRYGVFWHEMQELGLKAWLSGGALKVTKRTWYAHLYKGARYGRGYSTREMGHEAGTAFCSWYWMTDQYERRVRSFRWLLEQFWPVPTWPADLDAVFRRAHDTLRNPYAAA